MGKIFNRIQEVMIILMLSFATSRALMSQGGTDYFAWLALIGGSLFWIIRSDDN